MDKQIKNPLLGGSQPATINPLTQLPFVPPTAEDPRERAGFQTNTENVPNLQNVSGELKDYAEYGVSMFPQLQQEWAAKRAENQSGFEHAYGFLNQAVSGEIVGGTIEGIGWLGEIGNWGQIASGKETEVGNALTEIGEGMAEWAREATPIYQNPNNGKFAPWSSAWWAQNGVSVSSFASMLIPATGTVKAASLVGKGIGLTAKLGQAGRALGISSQAIARIAQASSGISTAIVSRHIENNMEAAGVFKEQYDKFIASGMEDREAKQLAGEAAQDTYTRNWAMLAQDIPQYMMLGSKFKLNPAIQGGLSKVVGKTAAGALTNKYLMNALSEGGEEAYQFWVGEESKYLTDVKAGLSKESSHADRMKSYLKNGDLWTAAFFGSIGGAAFEAAGPAVQNFTERVVDNSTTMPREMTNHLGSALSAISKATGRNLFYSDAIQKADEADNKEAGQYLRRKWNIDTAIAKLDEGTFDGYLKDLDQMANSSDEDKQAIAERMGIEATDVMDLQSNYKMFQQEAAKVKELYQGFKNDGYVEATLGSMITRSMDDHIATENSIKAQHEITNRYSGIKGMETLTPGSGEAVLQAHVEKTRIEQAIKMYEKLSKDTGITEDRKKRIAKRITDFKNEQKSADDAITSAEAVERTPAQKRADDRVIKRAIGDKGLYRSYNTKEFNDMLSEEAQDEIDHLQSSKIQTEYKHTADINELIGAQDPGELRQVVDKLKTKYGDNVPTEIANAINGTQILMELKQKKNKEAKTDSLNKKDIAEQSTIVEHLTPPQKEAMDVDDMRGLLSKNKTSAAETAEITNSIITEENIKGAAKADKAVAISNFNDENISSQTPETNSQPLPSSFGELSKKNSIMSFNWKSSRNGGPRNSGNQTLSDLLEDANFKIEGRKVELVANEDGIQAILLNDNGDRMTAAGEPVAALLHTPNDQLDNPHFNEAKRSELAALLAQVEKAHSNGQRVFTTITKRFGGHKQLSNEARSLREIEAATGKSSKLMISVGAEMLYHKGNPVKNTDAVGEPGMVYLETTDLTGKVVPMRVDAQYVTEAEANLLVDLFTDFQNPKVKFDSQVLDNPNVSGLTYAQAFELMVYEGSRTFNTQDKEGRRKDLGLKDGVFYFGERSIPIKDIESVRGDIINWLTTTVPRFVSVKKLNLPMTEGTKTSKFTFIGKEYTVQDKYNDFLIDSKKILTKLSPNAGKLFIQPTIEFSPVLDIEGSQEETTNQISDDRLEAFRAFMSGGTTEASAPSNPFAGVDRKKSHFSLAPSPAGTFDIANIEQEREWLKEKLPDVPVQVIEGLIKVANKGTVAYGAFKNSMIQLSNVMERGTAYHEAFHAVSQLYLSDKERGELYDEAISKYGFPTKEQMAERGVDTEADWLEEQLADAFRAYVFSEGKMKFKPKGDSFFHDLWLMIKHLFGVQSKVDRVFSNTVKGYYATAPLPARVERMSNRAMYNIANGLTISQFYDLVDNIMFDVVNESKALEMDDISLLTWKAISKQGISGLLATYYDKAITAENLATANIYVAALPSVDKIQQALVEKFSELQLDINSEVLAILDTDGLTEDEKTEQLNTKSAFEYSGKDNATGNVKLLISMLPKLRSLNLIESEGQKLRDYEINPNTGLPRMASPAATWAALSKALSGIVDTYEYKTGELTAAFDKMLNAMDDLAQVRPEISFLTEKLRDPVYPQYKKVQFFNAFSKANMNYYTARFEKQNQVKHFLFGKSESRSSSEQIRDEWVQSFKDRLYVFNGESTVLNLNSLASTYSYMTSLEDDVIEAIKTRKELGIPVPIAAFTNQLFNGLHASGVEMSRSAFDYWIETQAGSTPDMQLKNAVNSIAIMYRSKKGIAGILESGKENRKPWIKDEDTILKLAETEALFRDDLSEAGVLGADNAMYYIYSLNNFVTKKIQEIKNNDEYLERLAAIPYNQNSVWINELLNNKKARERFDYNVFNNMRETEAGDTGDKFSDLKPSDELALRINQTMKGRFSLLTAADKGVYITLTGPSLKSLALDFRPDGPIFNNVSTMDIIGNYFIDELSRMAQAWNEVHGENKLPEEQLVENYHKGKRHAFKSQLFPSLNPIEITAEGKVVNNVDLDKETLSDIQTYITSQNNKPTWSTKTVSQLRPKIESLLTAQLSKEIALAVETGVLKQKDGELINVGLDTDLINNYRGSNMSDTQAIKALMADYMVNSIIANIETSKLFTGDPAYYKSLDDLKKRVPGIIAPGQDLFIFNKEKQFFNVAIVKDLETNLSDTHPEIYNGYKTALIEAGISEAQATSMLSPYENINVADAQAYVTMDRYKDLLEMLGKWKPSMEKAFNKLKSGEHVSATDLGMFMQPLKGMYFDLVPSPVGNRMQPVYLKYSLAPLIPGVVRGTKMEHVMNAMDKQGIDELVFNSGIKVGARGQVDITSDELTFNPMKLDNRNWKLQQDLTAKYMKKGEAIEGSQVLKNVLANIDPTANYNNKTGNDLIFEFIQADKHLSNIGAAGLKEEFGISVDEENGIVAIDRDKLYPVLIKELKAEAPRYVIEALENRMSLDAIPQFRKKIQQKLLSMVNSRTVRLKMPGGAFIQLSPAMFESSMGEDITQNSDILWLNGGKELLPPRIENGVVKPGQILVPHSLVKKYPNFESLSREQQIAILNDAKAKGILEGVGYRIPNQDMASTDYLEIAGVLPAYLGDTLIAYPSITAKTGSDYDIDKMYFMMPNFTISDEGIISKVPSELTGKREAQNYKLDRYKEILTSPETFSRLVSPIDAEWLKQDTAKIRELLGTTVKVTDLTFFTASEQYTTKRKFAGGKHGVGQTANHLVDHVLTQLAGVFINRDFGLGHGFDGKTSVAMHKEVGGGRYITSNISAYLNAYVDIAKDPYIFDLNNNTFTANTVFLLLRMGVQPEWINRFMTQPIITEYTNLTLNSEGRVNEVEFDEQKKPVKPINIVESKYSVKDLIPLSKDSMPGIRALEEQLKNPTNMTQRQLLNLFLNLQEYAKSLNVQLRASKSDTVGAGKTLTDSFISQNLKLQALEDERLGNVDRKFDNTMLETYYDNSVLLALDSFGSEFIGMSQGIRTTTERIAAMLGKFPLTDSDIATDVENEAYTYVMKDFPLFQHSDPESLFTGNNTVGQRLEFLKGSSESPVRDNLMVRALQVKRGEGFTPDFVDITGSSKKDKRSQEALSEAWYEMILSDDPLVSEFAKDLVKYSFYTTGLNQAASSFFDLMPTRYLQQSNIGSYLHSIKDHVRMMNMQMQSPGAVGYLDSFIGRFFRNNWTNNKLVPNVASKARSKIKGYLPSIAFQINENSFNYVIGIDEHGRKVFYPYVKDGDTLYRLQGYMDTANTRNAIYARATKRGTQQGRFKIKDYGQKPMTLDSTLGVQLIEGQDFNVKYSMPVASSNVQEQRESGLRPESLSDMNTKIGLLKDLFNAEFVMDETLPGVAKVESNQQGSPVITINPNKVREDTVIHEVGHIYIDSLGGLQDPLIASGVKQLRGSYAEEFVTHNYPDLTGEAFDKEVLATAIGMEGAVLFRADTASRSRWNRWTDAFWAKVKALFGIQPNIAKQMAREILTNRIRKGEYSLSEYVQEQRSEDSEANAEDLDAVQRLLNRLKASLQLKINIHEQKMERTDNEESKASREKHVNNLTDLLTQINSAQNYEGILLFIERAQKDTEAIGNRLSRFRSEGNRNLENLQELRSYVGTYDIVPEIRRALLKVDEPHLEEIQGRLSSIQTNLDLIKFNYEAIAKDTLVDLLLPYTTRNEYIEFRSKYQEEFQTNIENQGNKSGDALKSWKARRDAWVNERVAENREEIRKAEREYVYSLIEESKADLNYFDSHILDPRGVNNQIIQMTVRMLDKADYKSMRDFQDTFKDTYVKWEKFIEGKRAKGITDLKKVYAPFLKKNKEGNVTNEYIDKFDTRGFHKAEASALHIGRNKGMSNEEALDAFYEKNAVLEDGKFVPNEQWWSAAYRNMSAEDKDMFDSLISINGRADEMVPAIHRLDGKLPSIKASVMESFQTNGLSDAFKEWRESTFTTESDQTELGQRSQRAVKDKFAFVWANEKLEQSKLVPIFFRASLDEKQQSFDLMGMAMSNYYMSLNFKNKSMVSAQIETFRDLIKASKIGETKDWKRKMIAGLGAGNLIPIQKGGEESNINKLMESLIDDRLYGIREIDAGDLSFFGKKVSANRLSKMFSGWTSDTALILNYASAATNLLMGHVQTFIRSTSGRYYTQKDIATAFAKYGKDLPNIIGDVGKEEHTSTAKTNLLLERFDVRGEFSGLINSLLSDTKIKRLLSKKTAHGLNSLAEHNIQGVLMYSLMNNIKVMNSKGEYLTKEGTTEDVNQAMSLDEAYSVKDGKLVIDERVTATTKDRSSKSFGEDQEMEISGFIKYINADLNGNYDANNRAIWQRHILGQQAFLMKKWIARAFKRRFRGIQYVGKDRKELEEWQRFYNEYTKDESEGLYTTLGTYISNVYKNFKDQKFQAFNTQWERLDDMQKANLVETRWEFTMIGVGLIGSALLAGMGDDDEKKSGGLYFTAYMFRRMYSELTFFMNPVEMLKMMDTPLLSLRTVSNLFEAFYALMPWNWEDKFKSGEHKGELKVWNKLGKGSPITKAIGQFDRDFEKSYNFLLRGF